MQMFDDSQQATTRHLIQNAMAQEREHTMLEPIIYLKIYQRRFKCQACTTTHCTRTTNAQIAKVPFRPKPCKNIWAMGWGLSASPWRSVPMQNARDMLIPRFQDGFIPMRSGYECEHTPAQDTGNEDSHNYCPRNCGSGISCFFADMNTWIERACNKSITRLLETT